jgi:hypothetical protein
VKKAQPAQTALGCAVLIALGIGGCYLMLRSDQSPEAQRARALTDARAIVTVLCEREMNSRLRAPGTADYPFGLAANVQPLGDDRYRLLSYVDAQNAFGGQVRTSFICVVEGAGDELRNYKVTEFTISP